VARIGDRWTFVTPAGHPFWLLAVYAVGIGDGGNTAREMLNTKFGGDQFAFAAHTLGRLRSWGFNAIGPYSSAYVLPVPTAFRKRTVNHPMPFIRMLNVSSYGSRNAWGLAPGPFKTLLAGAVDPSIYRGWPGHLPDVFDPNFEIYARNLAADLRTPNRAPVFTEKTSTGGTPHPSLAGTPWLIGTTPDDVDFIYGMGPGPEVPGITGALHAHIGWIVAVTRPVQTENREVGKAFGRTRTIAYSDPTVYAKVAWRDHLKRRYDTIERLNAAWGSTYTTFDSDGGWPSGRGLLDEGGHNRWIGRDPKRLSETSRAAARDMDDFLEAFADRYFRIVTEAARAATPHHLVFSPAMLNGHKGLSRRQVLRAAARYCDVIEINQHPDRAELVDITYRETGGKPLFTWMGLRANPDSAMHLYAPHGRVVATQRDRAAAYEKQVTWMFSHRAPDGIHPIIGLAWWEYMDKVGEKSNWGLVSPSNNAYDGREAVRRPDHDASRYPTGGELRDYGDFLSTVRSVNIRVAEQLARELGGASKRAVSASHGTRLRPALSTDP
jgi:hypothetical protein